MYITRVRDYLLLFIIFYHVVATYILYVYGLSNLSYRNKAKGLLKNSFFVHSIFLFVEVTLLLFVYIDTAVILFVLLGIDFYLVYRSYRTLYLLKYFAMSLGDKSNVSMEIGLFYIVVKMRNYYIFGIPGRHIKFVIIDRLQCRTKKTFTRLLYRKFISGKTRNICDTGRIELKLIEGEVLVRDPEGRYWRRFVGDFPVFILKKT